MPEGWVFFGDPARQNIRSRYDHPNKTVLIAEDSDAYAPPVDFVLLWHQARGNYEGLRSSFHKISIKLYNFNKIYII